MQGEKKIYSSYTKYHKAYREKTPRISLWLTAEMYDGLKAYAIEYEMTISDVVRSAIDHHLETAEWLENKKWIKWTGE